MKKFRRWVVRVLGLKGSWRWACRQMRRGLTVYRTTDTGCARYRLSRDEQKRITWTFVRGRNVNGICWDNAFMFLADFECACWTVWRWTE